MFIFTLPGNNSIALGTSGEKAAGLYLLSGRRQGYVYFFLGTWYWYF